MNILLCMPKFIDNDTPGRNGGGAWGWTLEKQFKRIGWNVTFLRSFEDSPVSEDMVKEQDIIMFRHSYQTNFKRYKDIVSKARKDALIVQNFVDKDADMDWESFRVCSETDVWIAQNRSHIDLCLASGFKSVVLHYPIDLNLFPKEPRISKDLLYVGRFCPQKGFEALIESFAIIKSRHPSATLALKGDWSWGEWGERDSDGFKSFINIMKKKIEDIGGISVIEGWTDPESVAEYYKKCSILIFPVNAEGYGAPVIEGQASAMPVITSNHYTQLEKIGEGIDGFCVPRVWKETILNKYMLPSPEGIADRVDFLFSDMGRIRSFGLAGRKKAEDMYDENKVMDNLSSYLTNELKLKSLKNV